MNCSKPYPLQKLSILLITFTFLFSIFSISQPNANFSSNKTGGCKPLAVSFTNTTTNASAAATYSWDFGNGSTSILQNPGAIFTTEQTYTITLTVTDNGKISVSKQQITVYPTPAIDFTVAQSKVCIPTAASFTATGTAANYYWDFGDGVVQQSSAATIQHNYSKPQTASVTLTAANNYGCTNTISKKDIVQIFSPVNVNFSADQTVLCKISDSIHFSNQSSGPSALTYLWNFGDGSQSAQPNPAHVFPAKGIYSISLTATSLEGCVVTNSQPNYVNVQSYHTDFSVPPLICQSNSGNFNFTGSPQPSNGTWFINGIQNYSYYNSLYYYFSQPGNDTIKLSNTFGACKDSAIKIITIQANPVLNNFSITADNKCGSPANYTFSDTSNAAIKWNWTITNNNYSWVNSTLQTVTVNYPAGGTYSASLSITNTAGCTASYQRNFSTTPPQVNISAIGNSNVCGPFSLTFSAFENSAIGDSIASYSWNFGDGTPVSVLDSPTHSYTIPGAYSITLSYVTKNGCSGNAIYGPVYENIKPTISFSALSPVCGNSTEIFSTQLTGNAYGYSPNITWNYGDGSYSYSNQNNHSYTQAGTYTITLTANFQACGDTTITKANYITVLPPFPAIGTPVNTCDGNRGLVTFNQTSVGATSLIWDFGDGSPTQTTPGNLSIMQHNYPHTGSYTAKLTAVNGNCSLVSPATVPVLLKQNPLLTSAQNSVCANGTINVTASNFEQNPYVGISAYNVNFFYSDSTLFNGAINWNNNYSWITNFTVSLVNFKPATTGLQLITTSYGFNCKDTSNIIPLAVLGSTAKYGILNNKNCYNTPIQFSDSSTATAGNSIVSRNWNFGDGASYSATNGGTVTHQYTNPGTYYVTLTENDAAGCTSSTNAYSNYVQLNGPKAGFSVSDMNPTITESINFYNYSNTFQSFNTLFTWNFGDGSPAYIGYYPPAHVYLTPGTYTITLQATDTVSGCSDRTSLALTVKNFFSAFSKQSAYIGTNNCPPLLINFTNNSYNYRFVSWDFGDGFTVDSVNNPGHIYKNPGKYIVKLTVYGPSGIIGYDTDTINVISPAATINLSANQGCIGQQVNFTGSSNDTQTFLWNFGDGNFKSGTLPMQYTYSSAGIFSPGLLTTSASGCTTFNSAASNVTIYPNPVINITPGKPIDCLGSAVQINATGANNYTWAPTAGLSNSTISNPFVTITGNTTYTVSGTDINGCKNTDSVTVSVVQPFIMHVSHDTAICMGTRVQLLASGANTYGWINNTNGISNLNSSNPIVNPSATTTYTVVGKDSFGCFNDTAQINIRVVPLPTVTINLINNPVQIGVPIQLTTVYSSDVSSWLWTPGTDLSCTDCPAPMLTPLAPILYTVEVKNPVGCAATDTASIVLECSDSRVFIPTAFTPNGDGKNDRFEIAGGILIKHIVIYGRWGNVVYERSNIWASANTDWWDGTSHNLPCDVGAYVYLIELQCPSGTLFTRKGTVVLIR